MFDQADFLAIEGSRLKWQDRPPELNDQSISNGDLRQKIFH